MPAHQPTHIFKVKEKERKNFAAFAADAAAVLITWSWFMVMGICVPSFFHISFFFSYFSRISFGTVYSMLRGCI